MIIIKTLKKMPKKGIPDRWEMYSPIGSKISRTNFISFKVPLNEALCSRLPLDKRFTPRMLADNVHHLGLVVDLTNTRRYYNPEELTSRGIKYEKIFCEGQKIPDSKVIDRFTDVVDNFLKNARKELLIGVHCTHGLNRTGYVVCRYMIDSLGFTPVEAISEFEKGRGHKLERGEYIEDLLKDRRNYLQNQHFRDGVLNNHVPQPGSRSFTETFHAPSTEFRSAIDPCCPYPYTFQKPVTWHSQNELCRRRPSPEYCSLRQKWKIYQEPRLYRGRCRTRYAEKPDFSGPTTNHYFNGRSYSYTAPGRADSWYNDWIYTREQ